MFFLQIDKNTKKKKIYDVLFIIQIEPENKMRLTLHGQSPITE